MERIIFKTSEIEVLDVKIFDLMGDEINNGNVVVLENSSDETIKEIHTLDELEAYKKEKGAE